ncbi:MAG: GGDEF domain-containing protein [Gemmatimonadaceae bacterium]|nr:GGDEF domain-containing protein [Gemmatimonadaceae bacterium]
MTPSSAPTINGLRGWWGDLMFAPDDPALIDAGHRGELLVAGVRFWTLLAVLLSPVITILQAPTRSENVIALVATGAGLIVAGLTLRALQLGQRIRHLAVATTVFDVSLVSLTQFLYLTQGLASVAANSRTTFAAYFVAIGSTCLRWDPRLCLISGALAVAQYGLIVGGAFYTWDPTAESVVTHGQLVLGQQAGRIVLLAAFTILCLAIIQQSRRLRFSSTHDALTRLMNRAYFEERLTDELSRASRHEIPVCVAVLDVDAFKSVNDTHGHAGGDAALRVVASVFRRSVRRTDLVCRVGGDEFAIAFPETRLAEAFGKLEQLRHDIESHTIVLSTGGEIRLTVSGGLAASRLDGTSYKEIVHAADKRLLEAKRAGRNRVHTSSSHRVLSGDWRAVVTHIGDDESSPTPGRGPSARTR